MTEPLEPAELDGRTPQDETKVRLCLRCATAFHSSWSGERICPHCKRSNGWRSGEAWRARAPVNH